MRRFLWWLVPERMIAHLNRLERKPYESKRRAAIKAHRDLYDAYCFGGTRGRIFAEAHFRGLLTEDRKRRIG